MFQFRRFPPYTYGFSIRWLRFAQPDCSIRKSTDQNVLTVPRGLSQLITSFIGSQCQGIRPALLLALPFVSCFWVLLIVNQILVVFLPDKFNLSHFTRSILICITFALFCFQVSFLFLRTDFNNLYDCSNPFSGLVGTNGLEPSTSRLSGVRSNHLSYAPFFGGDEEDRTPDPLRARQMLSQLSYTPIFSTFKIKQCSSNFSWLTRVDHFCSLTP